MQRAGVAAILSGHLHHAAAPAGTPPVLVSGSSLSHRVRGVPNSWSLVELDGHGPAVRVRVAAGTVWQDAAGMIGKA